MSLYLGENLISGSKPINLGVRNIGEIVSSSLPLTDAGLHLLDGSLILGGGIYQGFVDYIADLYTDNPSANYFTTEALWQTAVTTYGVCGKFVYDSVNNTVRLPKITGIIEGTTDVAALGELIEAGLPNITGQANFHVEIDGNSNFISSASGALQRTTFHSNTRTFNGGTTGSVDTYRRLELDASRSSSIYGNSNTVQPQTIKVLYYIVIATSTKTDIQVDIDEIATDLNGKADVDLTNVTPSQSFINTILNYGIPDWANGQSKTWNTTYTTTTAGLVYCGGWTQNGNAASITINNVRFTTSFTATSSAVGALIPFLIGAGDTYKASGTCTSSYLYWIPLKGVK